MVNQRFYWYALFLMLRPPISVAADSAALQSGYSAMYNLQFIQAHQIFHDYERDHPNDAMGPVSDAAAYLFSEFNHLGVLQSQFLTDNSRILDSRHLSEDPIAKRGFEAALSRTDTLLASELQIQPGDPNAMLAKTLRWGLHADYLALIQKNELAALKEIKLGRETAQLLLARHPDYQDANIAMGVENYLLSLKPAPLRFVLRLTGSHTDRDTGIKELRNTAAHGRYLAPYAKVLLAVAALRRGDRQEAKSLLTWLSTNYPGNALYRTELSKIN